MTEPAGSLAERLASVRARIDAACARAGRSPDTVTLVAVTKTVPWPRVQELLDLGQRDIGENRAQDLLEKLPHLRGEPAVHFVGRLQRNKVARLAPVVARWHSVDRAALGEAIARHAPGANVLVQVNVAEEPQKGGVAPAGASALVDALADLGLAVTGLMTVPPQGEDPRPHFARLRELAGRLGLADLSMGMSGDFEVGIEEGATIVRVGTALLGVRESGGTPG